MSAKELYEYLIGNVGYTAYDPECSDQKELISLGLATRRRDQNGELVGILDVRYFEGPQTYRNATWRARETDCGEG